MLQQKLMPKPKLIVPESMMNGNNAAQLGADRTNSALDMLKAAKLKATIRKRNRTRRKNKKLKVIETLTTRVKKARYSRRKATNYIKKMTDEIMAGRIQLNDCKPKQMICGRCYEIGCRIGPMVPA